MMCYFYTAAVLCTFKVSSAIVHILSCFCMSRGLEVTFRNVTKLACQNVPVHQDSKWKYKMFSNFMQICRKHTDKLFCDCCHELDLKIQNFQLKSVGMQDRPFGRFEG